MFKSLNRSLSSAASEIRTVLSVQTESGITKNIYKLNVHVGTDGETSRNAIPLSYKTYNLVTTFFCPFQKRYFQ